jgi:hypothetical protein
MTSSDQASPERVALRRGALAGAAGGVVQVVIGLLLDRWLLPPGQHNNIAPRLIKRLFERRGQPRQARRDWALGTLFHFGYAVGWGAVFGLVRQASGLPSWLLGLLMGAVIYLLAFSRIGAGTRTGTEPRPERRSLRKQLSLVGVAWGFALGTAALYDRLAGRPERQPTALQSPPSRPLPNSPAP